MNLPVIAVRPRASTLPASATAPDARERWVRRRVSLVWGLLFLNVLTFAGGTWNGKPLIVPIPATLGKLITQGALPLAFLLALTVNRRLVIRPNAFMCLLTLLAIEAVLSGVDHQGHLIGTMYRTARLVGFICTLWLLSPWWGRRDLTLLRTQLTALWIVLGSVLLGLILAPGRALAGGRLSGTFWPNPPTQVADLAAVAMGLAGVMWMCGVSRGRNALFGTIAGGTLLLLSHSRTPLVAMVAGIVIAGLSVFVARARVRRLFTSILILASVGLTAFSGVLTTWLARGENSQGLQSLTGRIPVWTGVLNAPRTSFQVLFGFGLSNKSFNGLPIDSNWLAAYFDLGLLGVAICGALLLFVLLNSYFQPSETQRAVALFLVTYLIITSITATGLSDASIAMLELALAASMLVPTPRASALS